MNSAFELLLASVSAGACWILWFFFLKEQRVDAFREDLFTIRGDLFRLAASGVVSFDDPAYSELRLLVNSMLRFGHCISLRNTWIFSRLSTSDPNTANAFEKWKRSVDAQPESVRAVLLDLHDRMFRVYMRHLFNGSITLILFKFCFITVAFANALRVAVLKRARPKFDVIDVAVNQMANSFHAQALEEQAYRDGSGLADIYALEA